MFWVMVFICFGLPAADEWLLLETRQMSDICSTLVKLYNKKRDINQTSEEDGGYTQKDMASIRCEIQIGTDVFEV